MPTRAKEKWIVLSPHLDDAALSCGGTIHRRSRVGRSTLVVTLMTGDPPVGPLSGFAEALHATWGTSAGQAYAMRRCEEEAALKRLGADFVHLGLADCIYRGDGQGYFYTSDDELFGHVHPSDERMVDEIVERLSEICADAGDCVVLAPLGVGGHVDHQLVRRAARRMYDRQVRYYEDAPYCFRDRAAGAVLAAGLAGHDSVAPDRAPLAQADITAKIGAVGCYRSQIGVLFGTHVNMAAQVWQHARRTAGPDGWSELLWCYST